MEMRVTACTNAAIAKLPSVDLMGFGHKEVLTIGACTESYNRCLLWPISTEGWHWQSQTGWMSINTRKKYLRWIDNIVMIVLRWRKMKTQATGFSIMAIMVMMPVFMVTMTMWWWRWHWWQLWPWFWRWWWCWRILRRVRLGYKQRASFFRSTPSLFIRRQTAKHDHLSWQAITDDQGDCHIGKVLMIWRKQGCSSICAKSYKIAQDVTSHIFSFSIL